MVATTWDTHVKGVEWAVCGSSSQAQHRRWLMGELKPFCSIHASTSLICLPIYQFFVPFCTFSWKIHFIKHNLPLRMSILSRRRSKMQPGQPVRMLIPHYVNSVKWLRSKEKYVQHHKYFEYLHQTNTIVFIIISTIRSVIFNLSSTIIT